VPFLPFDLCAPLPPPGATVLEASAGTGKTYALAGLVARFVAEGVAKLPEILAVSFTRAAAGELKERVRSRLVSAEAGLARFVAHGDAPPPDDELLALLASAGPQTADKCRQRLSEALANFDAATIATTHGFCYMVLDALGVWGDFSPGAVLLEEPRELVAEVVDDLYARWVARSGTLPFSPKEALTIGLEAVHNLGASLEPPADEADNSPVGLRRRLAEGVRREVARRLLGANLLTYDGMLMRLAVALGSPERGSSARRRLAERYRAVLVDEFQDTDLVQWDVLQRAFAESGARLVLIGDPKQAIYAFRGADVYGYLAAKRSAEPTRCFTLGRNWRSDACLAAACDALFNPLQFGHPEIAYRPMGRSCHYEGPGVQGAPVTEPLRLRWLDRRRPHEAVGLSRQRAVPKQVAVRLVAEDLASDVAGLLGAGARLLGRGGHEAPARALEPADLAVLVRTNNQAIMVQEALLAAGVPTAVSSSQSVMTTPAARDWLTLLDALQQPASRSLAAGAALGDFFGKRAETLASGDERFWEEVHARLQEWATVLQHAGVASLFTEICATERLPKRLLAEKHGERRLTDLAHIAELLHAEAKRSQLGPAALRAWLARRIEGAASESSETEEFCRRLSSGPEAVQVMTVHRAKGLEFPIVYCPYLWDSVKRARSGEPVTFHDEDGTSRKLDVGADGPSYRDHCALAQAETAGEELRQMYVAASRAKHQLVLWWVPATNCQRSALGRLLLSARSPAGQLEGPRAKEPRDEDIEEALGRLPARATGLVSIELMGARRPPSRPQPEQASPAKALAVMAFERSLDTAWGRLSYSSITAAAHGVLGGGYRTSQAMVSSEPEEPGTSDEPAVADEAGLVTMVAGDRAKQRTVPSGDLGDEESRLRAVLSPWAGIRAGAAVGTLVHRALQLADFAAGDLAASISSALGRCIDGFQGRLTGAGHLEGALEAVITTPLGPLVGGASLKDVRRADRLDELGFELPLAGGDKASGAVTTAALADVFSLHVRPDDLLGAYPEALLAGAVGPSLRGYLNGSLDLVFRLQPAGAKAARYFVVDYKTNWLAPPGEPLSAWHYRPAALESEMCRSHYVLQALFYLVALHRYLRWRMARYRPEEHLGGVLYLFVRGMVGPLQPSVEGQPCGVFSWEPPAGLVQDLSDLLAGVQATPPRGGAALGRGAPGEVRAR